MGGKRRGFKCWINNLLNYILSERRTDGQLNPSPDALSFRTERRSLEMAAGWAPDSVYLLVLAESMGLQEWMGLIPQGWRALSGLMPTLSCSWTGLSWLAFSTLFILAPDGGDMDFLSWKVVEKWGGNQMWKGQLSVDLMCSGASITADRTLVSLGLGRPTENSLLCLSTGCSGIRGKGSWGCSLEASCLFSLASAWHRRVWAAVVLKCWFEDGCHVGCVRITWVVC